MSVSKSTKVLKVSVGAIVAEQLYDLRVERNKRMISLLLEQNILLIELDGMKRGVFSAISHDKNKKPIPSNRDCIKKSMAKTVIKETTVLRLPDDKWERLKALCENDGMEPSINQYTGLSLNTVRRIKETGRGELRSLKKLLDYLPKAEKEIENLLSGKTTESEK